MTQLNILNFIYNHAAYNESILLN